MRMTRTRGGIFPFSRRNALDNPAVSEIMGLVAGMSLEREDSSQEAQALTLQFVW